MKRSRWIRLAFASLCVAMLAACSDDSPPPAADGAPKASAKDGSPASPATAKLEQVTIGDYQAWKLGNVYLGGQPSEKAIKAMNDAGVSIIINLRPEDEHTAFDEMKLCEELGVTYSNPGFNSPQTLESFIHLRVREVLSAKDEQQVLLHCASGNRVGAVWLAHRVLDDGVPYEQALEEARKIGMQEVYEQPVKQYIDSQSQP